LPKRFADADAAAAASRRAASLAVVATSRSSSPPPPPATRGHLTARSLGARAQDYEKEIEAPKGQEVRKWNE
jgi:hypothetical protein